MSLDYLFIAFMKSDDILFSSMRAWAARENKERKKTFHSISRNMNFWHERASNQGLIKNFVA